MHRIADAQRGGGAVHDVGRAHKVEHRHIVVVVAKGHDLLRRKAQHAAERLHADTLVGGRRVDPVRPRHGTVGLLPARHEAIGVFFDALVQVDRRFDDLLRNLGRVVDDLVPVADEFDAIQHAEAALH